jgi:hypothetical protein
VSNEIKSEKTFIPEFRLFSLVKHLWFHEINNESQLRLYTDLVVLIEKYGEKIINQTAHLPGRQTWDLAIQWNR